jgi:transposase
LKRSPSVWRTRSYTAAINLVRGSLREFGIVIPAGSVKVRPAVLAALEDADNELPMTLRDTLGAMLDTIKTAENGRHRGSSAGVCRRGLAKPLGSRRANTPVEARADSAASPSAVDVYLRILLIHGARAVLRSAKVAAKKQQPLDRTRAWALAQSARVGHYTRPRARRPALGSASIS